MSLPTSTTPTLPTVVHVEDDEMVAKLVSTWLASLRVNHVGTAPDIKEGMELCARLMPDVLLLDVWLPGGDGLDFADHLLQRSGAPKIILFSSRLDDWFLYTVSRRSRISGVVRKSGYALVEISAAIEAALNGRRYFSPHFLEAADALMNSSDAFFRKLTEREIDLLRPFGLGRSDKEISAGSDLSVSTVQTHRKHVMAKLGVHCLRDLMLWSFTKGIVSNQEFLRSNNPAASPRFPARRSVGRLSDPDAKSALGILW